MPIVQDPQFTYHADAGILFKFKANDPMPERFVGRCDKLIQGNEKAKDEEEVEEGPYSAWWCSITTRVRYAVNYVLRQGSKTLLTNEGESDRGALDTITEMISWPLIDAHHLINADESELLELEEYSDPAIEALQETVDEIHHDIKIYWGSIEDP